MGLAGKYDRPINIRGHCTDFVLQVMLAVLQRSNPKSEQFYMSEAWDLARMASADHLYPTRRLTRGVACQPTTGYSVHWHSYPTYELNP